MLGNWANIFSIAVNLLVFIMTRAWNLGTNNCVQEWLKLNKVEFLVLIGFKIIVARTNDSF